MAGGDVEAQLIDDPDELDALAPAWDALAVANRRPMAAPAWMLTGWRHLASPASRLRAVAVWDAGRLIGLAPFCVDVPGRGRVDYRLLTHETPRTEPLAAPARAWDVAAAVGRALASAQPRPDAIALEAQAVASPWPAALRHTWPGTVRPAVRQYLVIGSPIVSLAAAPSFDDWLAGRSANFRSQMRRARRQFAAAGGRSRTSTQETLRDDVAALMRLHEARWEGRGRSSMLALRERRAASFEAVGRQLLDAGRFRLRVLELDGVPISAQLFAAAGGEVLYYNGGWDERHARLKPAMLAILDEVEESFRRGDERFDLGPGVQDYKLRFADGTDPLAWTLVVLPGRRMPLTVARSASTIAWREARDAAKRALTQEQADRLRGARDRLRRR